MKFIAILISTSLFSCTFSAKTTDSPEKNIAAFDLENSLQKIQLAIKNGQFTYLVEHYTEDAIYLDSEIKISNAGDKKEAIKKYFSIQQVTIISEPFLNKKTSIDRGSNLLQCKARIINRSALLTDTEGYTEIQLLYSVADRKWKLQALNDSPILSQLAEWYEPRT